MVYEARIGNATATLVSLGLVLVAGVVLLAAGLAPWLVFVMAVVQGAGVGLLSILRPVLVADVLGRAGIWRRFGRCGGGTYSGECGGAVGWGGAAGVGRAGFGLWGLSGDGGVGAGVRAVSGPATPGRGLSIWAVLQPGQAQVGGRLSRKAAMPSAVSGASRFSTMTLVAAA